MCEHEWFKWVLIWSIGGVISTILPPDNQSERATAVRSILSGPLVWVMLLVALLRISLFGEREIEIFLEDDDDDDT